MNKQQLVVTPLGPEPSNSLQLLHLGPAGQDSGAALWPNMVQNS